MAPNFSLFHPPVRSATFSGRQTRHTGELVATDATDATDYFAGKSKSFRKADVSDRETLATLNELSVCLAYREPPRSLLFVFTRRIRNHPITRPVPNLINTAES